MADLQGSWHRAWRTLGVSDDGTAVRAALLAAYDEPQRSYHTRQHLHECLDRLEACCDLATRPAEAAFLAREHIYGTPRLHAELEQRARANLSLAIAGNVA
jgi:predicted metal-dependent HD superfamily phosphohydrolase